MTDCPQSEFFQVLKVCGVPVPSEVEAKAEITCDDWRSLLPGIHARIASLILKAGTTSNLEIERIDHDKAIESLKGLVRFIEEMCEEFVHIHVVDLPVDECLD